MRTPTWETSAGALAALLNSGAPLNRADCYTVTLPTGTVLRWSGSDVAITYGGNTFALGPGLTRNRMRWVVGVEVSTLDLTMTDNVGTTIAGRPLMSYVRARGFYGARVLLERVFWGVNDTAPVGALNWFSGRVADVQVSRLGAQLTCNSDTELLNVMVPGDVYQPGCLNTLYGTLCGVNRASYTSTGAATSASSTDRTWFRHNLGAADGYHDLGVVTMTSGPNAGISRTVKAYTSSGTPGLFVLQPWPYAVASGDTFQIVPGCNKTTAACSGKFSNAARFRGFPYIPVAETVT